MPGLKRYTCDDCKLAMSCFFTNTTDVVAGKLSSNTKQDTLAFVSYLKGQAKTPHSWPLHSWDPVEQQSRPTTRSRCPGAQWIKMKDSTSVKMRWTLESESCVWKMDGHGLHACNSWMKWTFRQAMQLSNQVLNQNTMQPQDPCHEASYPTNRVLSKQAMVTWETSAILHLHQLVLFRWSSCQDLR